MSYVRIIQYQYTISVKCVWTVCVFVYCLIDQEKYVSEYSDLGLFVLTVLQLIADVFGYITYFLSNLLLWGFIISWLLVSRPNFVRFFFLSSRGIPVVKELQCYRSVKGICFCEGRNTGFCLILACINQIFFESLWKRIKMNFWYTFNPPV
jgi:hypothetical protein